MLGGTNFAFLWVVYLGLGMWEDARGQEKIRSTLTSCAAPFAKREKGAGSKRVKVRERIFGMHDSYD